VPDQGGEAPDQGRGGSSVTTGGYTQMTEAGLSDLWSQDGLSAPATWAALGPDHEHEVGTIERGSLLCAGPPWSRWSTLPAGCRFATRDSARGPPISLGESRTGGLHYCTSAHSSISRKNRRATRCSMRIRLWTCT